MKPRTLKKPEQASLAKLVLILLKVLLLWLLAVSALFFLMELLPGDAATNKIGKGGAEAVAALRHKMGLDRPALERFCSWLGNYSTGNVGLSLLTEKYVGDIVRVPLVSSLSVTAIVLICLVFITIPIAVYCGYYKNALSRVLTKIAVILSSVPEFALTVAAIMLLCMKLKILPVLSIPGPAKSVWQEPVSLVMPSLCLWVISSAAMFRYIKVMVETYAKTPYMREAFLAGLSRRKVLFVHLLPSALPGIAQIMALTVPYLLGGSMVVETLTSFPGMGYTLIQAVQSRETPIVMAIGSLLIGIAIAFYLLADYLGRKNKRAEAST